MTVPEPPSGSPTSVPPAGLSVASRNVEGALVVSITGDLDMVTAGQMEEAVESALTQEPAVLIFDLTAVTFFSSPGLVALAGARQRAVPTSVVRVVGKRLVARPMALTGLDQLIPVFGTVAEALQPIDSSGTGRGEGEMGQSGGIR
jgi:anti-anti-sigma factor